MELGRAQGERDALERRRTSDRDRQRASREAKKVAYENECHVTSRDVTNVTDEPLPSPSPSFPPNPQTNPTPAHPRDNKPRARKADDFELPERIPAEPWDGYVAMRNRIRKPMTPYAKRLAVKELDRLAADGWPPGDVLNHCTMNSYQGIFPPKDRKNGNDRQGSVNRHHRGDGFLNACREAADRQAGYPPTRNDGRSASAQGLGGKH